MEDDGGPQGTARNGGKQRKATENKGRRQGTSGDSGDCLGRPGTVGDGPSLVSVEQVPEKTGTDDRIPSVLVLAQDGRSAQLRTLLLSGLSGLTASHSNSSFTTSLYPFLAAHKNSIWP